ncbi:caspase family protein [Tateyamaria sp. Alg231-49]|uniref:caspase family protein n=1 Tax=Tateyamaria sp. Alg231-49 TaxID=1922219 RepID=UPI00131F1986|nr:caspase family protein [Tateyamaria sp. Alg231-49]
MDFLDREEFKRFRADIPGHDLVPPYDSSLLRDLTHKQCEKLCVWTPGCKGYTWNEKAGKACFLKSKAGRMVSHGHTVSAHFFGDTKMLPLPATRGPLPSIQNGAGWQPEDTSVTYVRRIRDLSKDFARSCDLEREDLRKLTEALSARIAPNALTAGSPIPILWQGNTLKERIAVWVVVSSDEPFRTQGPGAMVLGPAAIGPFGMEYEASKTRAFVPLWSRGTGENGEIRLIPLQAGKLDVKLSLVAYLRACEEEAVLGYSDHVLEIGPKPAELVIGNPNSRADLTHFEDVQDLDRKVIAGPTRVRVEALSNVSEIIERAGENARLSPTRRFMSVEHDGFIEIIDLVDGATVEKLDIHETTLRWGHGDSVVFGSSAPWGKIDLVYPFASRKAFSRELTGPACCFANEDSTHISFDAQNGLASIRGRFGHAIGIAHAVTLSNGGAETGHLSLDYWTPPMHATFLRSVGLVAPTSVNLGYNIVDANGEDLQAIVEAGQPVPRVFSADSLETLVSTPKPSLSELSASFERLGITFAPSSSGTHLVEPETILLGSEALGEQSPEQRTRLVQTLKSISERTNLRFELLEEPRSNWLASNCFDYLGGRARDGRTGPFESDITNQVQFAPSGHLAVPERPHQLDTVEFGETSLLVGRVHCASGATGGSRRGQAYLFMLNLKSGSQPQYLDDAAVIGIGFMGAAYSSSFVEHIFELHLSKKLLLVFAPGNGSVLVIEPKTGELVREFSAMPSGDLMVDVQLTEDEQHIVQINGDGSFAIFNIGSGNEVLAGRIVEDEIAVWDKNYFFDATAEAASLIDLRFPGLDEQFGLDRFAALLHRAGLAETRLSGQGGASIEINIPPKLEAAIESDGASIRATLRIDKSRSTSSVEMYQDGVLTDQFEVSNETRQLQIETTRLPGAQYVSFVAVAEDGLASKPVVKDLGFPVRYGERRALAVAVDRYMDPELTDLNYAKADADRILQSLEGINAQALRFERTDFVGGRRATPSSVLDAISATLDGVGPDGHVTFFFAGHGLQGHDGEYYLALSQTDVENLADTAVNFRDIANLLSETPARVTVLIDACHSGDAGSGMFATNDGALAGLGELPANVTILAAAKGRQFSLESMEVNGGHFSVAVERVLGSDREQYDLNANGRIEASELANGVKSIVELQTGGQQVPWMTKGRVVGDYALF